MPSSVLASWTTAVWRYCSSSEHRRTLKTAMMLVGVTLALLIYGVLQERIMTVGFGVNKELFKHSIFLVLCNRLCTCIMAFSILAFTSHEVKPAAPLHSYAAVSFTNVIATSCQYEALKYVTFAVQTLAKSAKALPVMIWGAAAFGKSYRATDYLHASTITLGCSLFVLTGDISSRVVEDKQNGMYLLLGTLLMLVYLAVDGLTSTWQDSLFTGYQMGICDQVLYTTAFSSLLSLTAAVVTGQLLPSLTFVIRHPEAMWWILALSASSAVVQLIISFTIKQYGAVVFATIMTTRQFFAILLSSAVFWTPLSAWQWAAVATIFGALYYKTFEQIVGQWESEGRRGESSVLIDVEEEEVDPMMLDVRNPLLATRG